jgi:hypothetical protein
MKLSTPLTTNLGLGVQRRIIEANDSIVEVPSTVIPTLDIIQPTNLGGTLTTTVQQESFVVQDLRNITNQAAIVAQTVCTLGVGLWTIQFVISFVSTIVTAINVGQAVRYSISNGVFFAELEPIMLATGTQVINVQSNQMRFLLRDPTTIIFDAPATAVGDIINMRTSINCQKAL